MDSSNADTHGNMDKKGQELSISPASSPAPSPSSSPKPKDETPTEIIDIRHSDWALDRNDEVEDELWGAMTARPTEPQPANLGMAALALKASPAKPGLPRQGELAREEGVFGSPGSARTPEQARAAADLEEAIRRRARAAMGVPEPTTSSTTPPAAARSNTGTRLVFGAPTFIPGRRSHRPAGQTVSGLDNYRDMPVQRPFVQMNTNMPTFASAYAPGQFHTVQGIPGGFPATSHNACGVALDPYAGSPYQGNLQRLTPAHPKQTRRSQRGKPPSGLGSRSARPVPRALADRRAPRQRGTRLVSPPPPTETAAVGPQDPVRPMLTAERPVMPIAATADPSDPTTPADPATVEHNGDSIFSAMMNNLIDSGRAAHRNYHQVVLPQYQTVPYGMEYLYFGEAAAASSQLARRATRQGGVVQHVRSARNGQVVGFRDRSGPNPDRVQLFVTPSPGKWQGQPESWARKPDAKD